MAAAVAVASAVPVGRASAPTLAFVVGAVAPLVAFSQHRHSVDLISGDPAPAFAGAPAALWPAATSVALALADIVCRFQNSQYSVD